MKKSFGAVHKFTKAPGKRSTSDGAKALSLWRNHGLVTSQTSPEVNRATQETSLQTHCAASTSVQRSQQKSARQSVRRRNSDAM